MSYRKQLGRRGELVALQYYRSRGFDLVAQNVHLRYGEIDLILKHNDLFVFVEVKTRRSKSFGYPEDAITSTKIERMRLCAELYCMDMIETCHVYELRVCTVFITATKVIVREYEV